MKDLLFDNQQNSPIEVLELFPDSGISLYIKREDLLHQEVSGNKFRKLKYNLIEARKQGEKQLLTFGGAFSNHIAAVAAAGSISGFRTIGVVRGEELGKNLEKTLNENPTLKFAASRGMKLHFVSRLVYREKEDPDFISELKMKFGSFYLIPEGGTNELAVKGCEEILSSMGEKFDFVCCPVGTGGTLAGIVNSSEDYQVLGFPALKGNFLEGEIEKYTSKKNWQLLTGYHFGGYAKVSEELIDFINTFRSKYDVLLDPVYTGKMFFGIFDMIKRSKFPPESRILAIHTGGLQGIKGMNRLLFKKNLPQINV